MGLVAPGALSGEGTTVLERALERASMRWEAAGLAAERVAGPGEAPPPGLARVVVGAPGDPSVAPLLAALGVEDREAGVALHGRKVPRAGLRLVATWEDPERPGLPLTLVCAEDPAVRAALLDGLHPGARPHLWLWNGPEPVLRVGLNPTGQPRHETFLDLTPGRMRWPESYISRGANGRKARFHRDVERARVDAVRAALDAALPRAERWLPADVPAGESLEPALLVEAWMDDLAMDEQGLDGFAIAQVGRHAIEVRMDPSGALAAEQAAAAAAAQRLLERLGPAALDWLPRAAGIEAADGYGGHGLERWLQDGRGWPGTLAELVDGDGSGASPHERDPARALLVRIAIEEVAGELALAWRGTAPLDWSKLEARWRARMRPPAGESPPRRGLRVALAPLGALVEPPFDPRLGSLGSSATGAELAGWAERGLGRVALVLHVVPPGPSTSGLARGGRRDWGVIGGDAAAVSWLLQARALGLGATVVVSDLTSPSGTPAGERVMGSAREVRTYFEARQAAVAHAACLARMADAEVLCLGQGQVENLLTERHPETGEGASDEILSARRLGWEQSIETARALFPGALTVARSGQAVTPQFGPGSRLDVYSISLAGDLTIAKERVPAAGALLPKRAALYLKPAAERAQVQGQPWMVLPLDLPVSSLAARGRQLHAGPTNPHEARRVLGAWARALVLEQAAGRAPVGVFLREGMISALEGQEGLGENPLRSLVELVGGSSAGSY